jgi:hypothetical protein
MIFLDTLTMCAPRAIAIEAMIFFRLAMQDGQVEPPHLHIPCHNPVRIKCHWSKPNKSPEFQLKKFWAYKLIRIKKRLCSSSGFNSECNRDQWALDPSHQDGSMSIIRLTNNCSIGIGQNSFFGLWFLLSHENDPHMYVTGPVTWEWGLEAC